MQTKHIYILPFELQTNVRTSSYVYEEKPTKRTPCWSITTICQIFFKSQLDEILEYNVL